MASIVVLPAALAEALGHMQRIVACPEDVKSRIAALRVPTDEVCGTRMQTNWRQGPPAASGESGWRRGPAVAGGGGGGPGPATAGWNRGGNRPSGRNHDGGQQQGSHRPLPDPALRAGDAGAPRGPRRPFADRSNMLRFGNKGNKEASTESRMMDRIRSKMNMFAEGTYAATKTWLSELLDSGEAEFLEGFIILVFEKAAAETGLTALYAKLLVELRAAFPHIDVELRRIFGEFQQVFTAAAAEPDVGSEEYGAFVKARERRRYRRGYAAFIGDIANGGALTVDDVMGTCTLILDGLYAAKAEEGNAGLVEEYADCLSMMLKGARDAIVGRIGNMLPRIKQAQDRNGAPSMSAKARFALMDITDEFRN
jgi:hypothetical protein